MVIPPSYRSSYKKGGTECPEMAIWMGPMLVVKKGMFGHWKQLALFKGPSGGG